MGNPLWEDEVGKMCFNPAKNGNLTGMMVRALIVNTKYWLIPSRQRPPLFNLSGLASMIQIQLRPDQIILLLLRSRLIISQAFSLVSTVLLVQTLKTKRLVMKLQSLRLAIVGSTIHNPT